MTFVPKRTPLTTTLGAPRLASRSRETRRSLLWGTAPVFLLLLLALPCRLHATATAKKSHPVAAQSKKPAARPTHAPPKSTRVPGKNKAKTSAKTTAKGKKARVPRTLRTVPVSPIVRQTAVERIESTLADTSTNAFTYPGSLNPFFAAIAAQPTERSPGQAEPAGPATAFARTVRVLQFGDSHTAADIFTGELRAQFQGQFGDGGLGFQFPGHPFPGYHLAGSVRSQTSGWVTQGNRFTALGDGDLGLGGLSIDTTFPDQSITLDAPCSTLQLHYLRQPGGGRLQFTDNGVAVAVVSTATDTAAPASPDNASSAGTFSYACVAGTHEFQFTTLDHAPVKLLGIVTEQPGVTWECLGINGAIAPLILRWNQPLFADYLRQRDPALIVLAYGTNEAGSSAEHLEGYPEDLAQILDTLHRNAPQAAVLILGPADRAVSVGRGRRASWHPLTGTDRIIAMQKQACATHGCAFWDTRRRMGGLGSMPRWVAAGWAQPDRTHLTGTGYRALADALYADIVRAYNLSQQHPEPVASSPSRR